MSSSNSASRARGSLRDAGSPRAPEAAAWELTEFAPVAEPDVAFDVDPVDPADTPAEPEPTAPEAAPPVDMQADLDAAYTRGVEDGRVQGAALEAARVADALTALDAAVQQFRDARPRWLDALDRNLAALAVGIAREILGREFTSDPADVSALVQRALAEFPVDAAVRVRLHPEDLSAISTPGAGAAAGRRNVRWIPDPELTRGGCMVDGPETIVDGRIEKALEQIYSRLAYD